MRSADRAREISDGTGIQASCVRDGLSEGDQGLLYETERGRQDGGGYGLSRSGHRRDHRRQPERGRPGAVREENGGNGAEQGRLPVLSRPSEIRFGAPCRIRARL